MEEFLQDAEGSTQNQEAPTIDTTIEDTLSAIRDRENVPESGRDEQGRFKGVESEVKTEIQGEVKAPEPEIPQPPSSLKGSIKEKWAGLDPEVREEFIRRDNDYHNQFKTLQTEAQFGNSLKSVIDPYVGTIAAHGGKVDGVVSDALYTANIFWTGTQSEKYNALMGLAKNFGIPLDGQPVESNTEIDRLNRELNQLKTQFTSKESQEKEAQINQSALKIQSWINEAGEDGKPIRPYFSTVEKNIMPFIENLRAQNPTWDEAKMMQEAYDQAVWANPETRKLIQDEQQAKAKHSEESLRRVADAKKAASINIPRRGVFQSQSPTGSIDDTIRETYQQLKSR